MNPPPGRSESDRGAALPSTPIVPPSGTYEFYERLVVRHGEPAAARELADGRRVILGLRVVTNVKAKKGLGLYDDRFVVLWREEALGRSQEFWGSTEPSAFYEDAGTGNTEYGGPAMGMDVDGDGRLDLGCIPFGTYTYYRSRSAKFGNVLRSRGAIRSIRDSNHDGVFDDQDVTHPDLVQRLDVNDFLFHPGLPDRTGSAGCQTLPPDEYSKFWNALGSQEEFLYVLIEAPEPGTNAT